MAVAYVSSNSASLNSNTTGQISISTPTSGNLMVTLTNVGSSSTQPTFADSASGTWTVFSTSLNYSGTNYIWAAYKFSAGTETWVSTSNSGTKTALGYIELSGAANPIVLDNSGTIVTSTSSGASNITTGTISTSNSGSAIIAFVGMAGSDGTTSPTWTSLMTLFTNGGISSLSIGGYYIPGATVSSQSYTASWSTSRASGSMLLAIEPPAAPTVTSSSATSITTVSATCPGNITSNGGTTVTGAGICYGTSPNPTTSNSKVTTSTTSGAFNCNLTGLTTNTLFYYRAYATNSVGTGYSADLSFTTGAATGNMLALMGF